MNDQRRNVAKHEISQAINELKTMMINVNLKSREPSRRVTFDVPDTQRRNQTRSAEGVIRCWNCDKLGHSARFCRASGRPEQLNRYSIKTTTRLQKSTTELEQSKSQQEIKLSTL